MFGFMSSRQKSVDPPSASGSGSSPFDSDTEDNKKNTITPARRTSSEPVLLIPDLNDDDHGGRKQTSASTRPSPARNRDRYKNDFRDSGGLQSQTMEDLENYAVYKAEDTTNSVNNCLKIAENIREDAARTLDTLHQQGQQIERTHVMAVEIDKDLNRGEKLLNSLGGMFSMPWRPKKTREIKGPVITSDKSSNKSENNKEQREKLGLASVTKARPGSKTPAPVPTNAIQKVEVSVITCIQILVKLAIVLRLISYLTPA
ncbi:hypothetical protein CRYUN_Cryun29cG0093600 [Craigia yunnanensis]